jgi:hypothetical protein
MLLRADRNFVAGPLRVDQEESALRTDGAPRQSRQTPFVRALDTSTRSARRIDLDALTGSNLSRPRLHVDPRPNTLTANSAQRPLVVIDTRSFRGRRAHRQGAGHAEACPRHAPRRPIASFATGGPLRRGVAPPVR